MSRAEAFANALDKVYVKNLQARGVEVGLCGPWDSMSRSQKRAWIAWTVRHFGGAARPLVGEDGEPTSHALAARAYGLPTPRKPSDVRAILDLAKNRLRHLDD